MLLSIRIHNTCLRNVEYIVDLNTEMLFERAVKVEKSKKKFCFSLTNDIEMERVKVESVLVKQTVDSSPIFSFKLIFINFIKALFPIPCQLFGPRWSLLIYSMFFMGCTMYIHSSNFH